MLVPIRNFAEVDSTRKIYRSAQPQYDYEYHFLHHKLGVDTIVNLRAELDHDSRFAPNHHMNVVTIPMKDHFPPTVEQANSFIKLIKESDGVLFHCEHGHGRTSLFCVLARIAMGWSLDDAIKEETDVFGYEFQHPAQVKFLQDNFSQIKTEIKCA